MTSKLKSLPQRQTIKWASCAMATAAATTAANAAYVQIDLTNYQISLGSNTLNADVNGGGDDFVLDAGSQASSTSVSVGANVDGIVNWANYYVSSSSVTVKVNDEIAFGTSYKTGLVDITLTGGPGAGQAAKLQVTASVTNATDMTVTFDRVIFATEGEDLSGLLASDADHTIIGSTENGSFTAVPEPSSLALLALGAGGLLTRRRRQAA